MTVQFWTVFTRSWYDIGCSKWSNTIVTGSYVSCPILVIGAIKKQSTNQLKSVMNRATQLHKLLIYWMESLPRHHKLDEHIDSWSQTISSALILFSVSLACIHSQVACIFPVSYAFHQYAFLINPPKSFFFLIRIASIRISIFLVQQRSFLWLSQNICCLSMKINYRGGDYLTLSDGYCSGMLFEQLV